jgi:protein SCO1/2
MKLLTAFVISIAIAGCASADTPDKPQLPKELQGIGIDQRLNAQAPLDASFTDESGREVRLGDYLGTRPAILALVYYRCTMLCSYILNGVVSGLRPLSLRPGRDFDVIAISIDSSEDSALAAAKREHYAKSYSSKLGTDGWHFLTGREKDIRAVADAVGFHYRYDPKTQLFLHGSGVMLLTPEGRVARYFYGVEYTPKDLKLGLIEASANKIGSRVDQILLFCYHYDPVTGKYGAVVVNMLRIAAAAVLLLLVVTLTIFWRRDLRAARALRREAPTL